MFDILAVKIAALQTKLLHFLHTTYVDNFDALLQSMAISLGMVLFVWIIEIYYTGWEKSGMRRVLFEPSRSTINDIVFYFIHISGAVLILSWVASLGIPVIMRGIIRDALDLDLGLQLFPVVHLLLYLFLLDLFIYWQHRLMHRYPVLWQIHAFHHSADEFNTITVFREHPLDKAVSSIMSIIPAILLGIPVEQYPIFITIYGMIGYLKHSQIPWRLGWFGKYVCQSPVDHWIHHSNEPRHYDTNFANVFAIWDHVFGTYYKGDDVNTSIGLKDAPYNKRGWIHDIIKVQILFMTSLYKSVTRRQPRTET